MTKTWRGSRVVSWWPSLLPSSIGSLGMYLWSCFWLRWGTPLLLVGIPWTRAMTNAYRLSMCIVMALPFPPVKCLGSHQKLLVLKSLAEEPDPILSYPRQQWWVRHSRFYLKQIALVESLMPLQIWLTALYQSFSERVDGSGNGAMSGGEKLWATISRVEQSQGCYSHNSSQRHYGSFPDYELW